MYEIMDPVDFGRELIKTGDLDPIYVMLVRAREAKVLDDTSLARWCVAYWMFYSAYTASRIVEDKDYWYRARLCAADRSERGTERRHFRGFKAEDAVLRLRAAFPAPESLVTSLIYPAPIPFSFVERKVKELPQFGPWMAFKIADMIDRVFGVDVDFSSCSLSIYREPVKGGYIIERMDSGVSYPVALQLYERASKPLRQAGMGKTIIFLKRALGKMKAPPRNDRPIGIPEIETIMCKYKSHLSGHYPMMKDTHEIRMSLTNGQSKLGRKLATFLE